MRARILKLVIGVHMGLGHEGLKTLLAKPENKGGADIDVSTLAAGELVLCVNSKRDKLKVIGNQGLVIGYLRMGGGQKLMMDALRFVPATFGAGGFDYNKALAVALQSQLASRKRGTLKSEVARAKAVLGS